MFRWIDRRRHSSAAAGLLAIALLTPQFLVSADYPTPKVPLFASDGYPKGGYWALEPDPASDPTGKKRHGRLLALPPPQPLNGSPAGLPLVADYASQQFDENGLYSFRNPTPKSDANLPHILFKGSVLDLVMNAYPSLLFASIAADLQNPYSTQIFQLATFLIWDSSATGGESYTATLGTRIWLVNQSPFILNAKSQMEFPKDSNPPDSGTRLRVLFRFFPDGSQVGPLDEGEIALFQGCNYTGKATVFIANTPDFSKLTSSATTLDKSAASVRLGNNTAVTLYSGAAYSGTSQVIKTDTACLDSTPIGRNTSSIQVSPLIPVMLSSKSCENCLLRGVNLAKTDLSGIDLTGAHLDEATLTGAILTNTVLNGATLSGALGLTGADLSKAQLKGAKFVGTDLTRVTLPPILNQADLTRATLTGVKLQNISLNHAILDGALGLAGADLSQVAFNNASLRQVNLSGAKLYGATLNSADLEGSNLSGATLTNDPSRNIMRAASLAGAHLKNVNLANALLSGVDFTNSSFYGTVPAGQNTCAIGPDGFTKECASASHATLNRAQFGGAYLFGADFSSATIIGVQFGNSVLAGANFTGAQLSTDPKLGAETGFTSAFLQGANLVSANLQGTSLQGAFLDFRPGGNDLYMLLDGTHTTFFNWKTPGQAVCVFAYYGSPTTVPTMNSTLTCPDGSSAQPNGCGPMSSVNQRWASPTAISQANPPASYLQDATYTKAAPPICVPSQPW